MKEGTVNPRRRNDEKSISSEERMTYYRLMRIRSRKYPKTVERFLLDLDCKRRQLR